MSNKSVIRNLVNRALLVKRLTPELENMINLELSEQGYITDPDYEALEYLMQAIDQGKVRQVSSGQPHKKSKGKEMFKISQIPSRLMTFSSHTGLRRLITA